MPLAPLSLLPIASVIIKFGKLSRNSSLHVCENKTALDDTANNDDTSGASLAATISFHASSSGRAIASPVIIIKLAFSEAIVFQTPLASNFSRSTVELPTKLCPITLHCDAPCMSGGSGYVTIENPVFPFGIKSVGCDTFSPLRISIPPPRAIKTSSCLQTTPFGIPVVPPVNKMYWSSFDRGAKSRCSDSVAIAVSYSAPITSIGRSGCTACAWGTNSGCTTKKDSPAFANKYANSSVTYR